MPRFVVKSGNKRESNIYYHFSVNSIMSKISRMRNNRRWLWNYVKGKQAQKHTFLFQILHPFFIMLAPIWYVLERSISIQRSNHRRDSREGGLHTIENPGPYHWYTREKVSHSRSRHMSARKGRAGKRFGNPDETSRRNRNIRILSIPRDLFLHSAGNASQRWRRRS